MGISMKGNFIKGGVMGVGSTTISSMEGMRGIGLMEDMMGMVLKVGKEGVGIEGNIDKD